MQSTAVTVQRKLKIRKRKRKEICLVLSLDLNVDSVVDDIVLCDCTIFGPKKIKNPAKKQYSAQVVGRSAEVLGSDWLKRDLS